MVSFIFIYGTGLLLAQVGTGLTIGQLRGWIPLFGVVALCRKAVLEEQMMVKAFGDQYEAYAVAVPFRIAYGVW